MGIITIEKIDRLWWLGRYVERAFTSIRCFMAISDQMIDVDENCYKELCQKLGIPDCYEGGSDFRYRYPLDENNPDSILSSIVRAMDNAMILRETIGSETLGYLQLTLDKLRADALSEREAEFLHLQNCLDLILAFWGSVEDNVDDERIRNVIRAGKRLERLDLMLRMGDVGKETILIALNRLKTRLDRSPVSYNLDNFETLEDIVQRVPLDRNNALALTGKILEG